MMARYTFAFNNVLLVDQVDKFYARMEHLMANLKWLDMTVDGRCEDSVQYMDCHVLGQSTLVLLQEMNDRTYPKLRNIAGIIQFASKHKLEDVKRFFLSDFGETLCLHLFVVPVPNVYKFRKFVTEERVCQRREWGKFKNRKNKNRKNKNQKAAK